MSTFERPTGAEKLVINLWRSADRILRVRSVEIVDRDSRVRISFSSECRMAAVFEPRVHYEMDMIVQSVGAERGLTILPDLRVDLDTLILEGCRVTVGAARDGVEHIMIRFVRYFGRIHALFREEFAHRDCLAETAVDQAINALEEVYMPLRNFSAYLDDVLSRGKEMLDPSQLAFLRSIRNRIAGMEHVSDVISHYVASQSMLHAGSADRKQEPIALPPPEEARAAEIVI